jgi:hypothetical protein
MITQNIRSAADQDTASSVKTSSKETVERMDGRATEAQPKAGTPETGGEVSSPGVMETRTSISKWRQKRYRNVSKWAVVASTLRH